MGPKKNKPQFHAYPKKRKPIPEIQIIKALQSKYHDIDETKVEKFTDLPISKQTLDGLRENNYVGMTDIQKQSIGLALKGYDILGAAKTGSGKTLAFLIPVIENLYCKQWSKVDGLGALIITPTRELSYYIYETLKKVGFYHDFSAGLIIGGKDLKFERTRMDQCNIVICTPGRLLQHMDENPLFNCTSMQILVLDEADRCLDMGFQKTMNCIIMNLPPERQTLLFSATQTKSVKDLARLSLKDPLYISVHEYASHITPDGLLQSYIVSPLEDKMTVLWSFLRQHLKQKIIVFFSTCKQVKFMFKAFCRLKPGISLMVLHGELHQLKRMEVYDQFCRKQRAVLFATDLASRGLDFPAVNWVVQMDCPEDENAYIHRAGRTARFEKRGEALLMLLPSEIKIIEKLEKRKIPINEIKINPLKLQNPQRKLEAFLARDVQLKESAQRAFMSYIKNIARMKDKEVFDVHALDTDAYAKSLGLAVSPRIRFLQRMEKRTATQNNENKLLDESSKIKENKSIDECSDSEEYQTSNDDDSDDEVLRVKRKNIDIEDIPGIDNENDKKTLGPKKEKPLTKVAVAKKTVKKKILPNKKITFDDQGEEIIDPSKSKVSELGRAYEKEAESGINIEIAKQILREEDQYDKQRFRERVKEKHREEKRKLKALRKKKSGDEDEEEEEEGEEEEENSCQESEDEKSEMSNSEKDETNSEDEETNSEMEEADSGDEGTNSEEEEEETNSEKEEANSENEIQKQIPRSKRKSTNREQSKERVKKQRTTSPPPNYLKTDEELALQLLQN